MAFSTLQPADEAHSVIERRAWSDVLAAASRDARRRLGISSAEVGGATALRVRGVPSILFNRVMVSPAPDRVPTRAEFQWLLAAFDDAQDFWLHVPDSVAKRLGPTLHGLGMREYRRAWVDLERGDAPVRAVRTPLHVRPAGIGDADAVANVLASGFSTGEASHELWRPLVQRPDWHVHVATDPESDHRVVAASLLFVHGEVGYIAGASTLLSHRGRGAQGALLSARIRLALHLGCRRLFSETGVAVPGEPNHSQRNMERLGFSPVGLRHNYCPVPRQAINPFAL